MKTPSLKLFELIHSLSKSEKRNFVIFARSHEYRGDNLYLKLFDSVEKLKTYDEEQLKKSLDKRISVNLPFYKNYLYNLVLDFLAVHHMHNTITNQVLTDTIKLNVLEQKGLRKHSLELTKKIKINAASICRYDLYLPALEIESLVLLQTLPSLKSYDAVVESNRELEATLEKLLNIKAYEKIDSEFAALGNKFGFGKAELAKAFKRIEKHPLIVSNKNANNIKSQVFYYMLNSFQSYVHDKPKEQMNYFMKLESVLRENPTFTFENLSIYSTVLYNLCYGCIKYALFDKAKFYRQKLSEVIESKQCALLVKNRNTARMFLLDTYLYIKSLDVSQLNTFVIRYTHWVEHYSNNLLRTYIQTVDWNIAVLYFLMADYKECKKWLHKRFTEEYNTHHELFQISKILDLMIAVERNDFSEELLVEKKQGKSSFVGKYPATYAILTTLLNNLRNNHKNNDVYFKEAHEAFKKQIYHTPEVSVCEFLAWDKWLLGKSQRKSLLQLLRTESNKK